MNIKLKDIEEQLEKADYYKQNDNYDYLLKMPISQLTLEKKENLDKEVLKLKNKIDELKDMSIIKIWETELQELLTEWNNHKKTIEEDYMNDLKGDVVKSTAKRGAPKKK
jgi:ribosome recycling factor